MLVVPKSLLTVLPISSAAALAAALAAAAIITAAVASLSWPAGPTELSASAAVSAASAAISAASSTPASSTPALRKHMQKLPDLKPQCPRFPQRDLRENPGYAELSTCLQIHFKDPSKLSLRVRKQSLGCLVVRDGQGGVREERVVLSSKSRKPMLGL